MRLILARHGESEWNRDGRILGRADIELSETGQRQAHTLALALQREGIQVIYSSPLRRAIDTARIISDHQGCPVIPDPDLQELGRGNLEGMTRQEALTTYPDLQRTWPEVSGVAGLYGQETLEQLNRRVGECLSRIRARHSGDTVGLVGHYFVNLVILLKVLEMELRRFRSFGQALAAISILDLEKDRSKISVWNDTCHLRRG